MSDAATAIDMTHLSRYTGGDKALENEILSIFEHQTELWMRLLDPNAPDDAWKDAAHSLKGSAKGVGAWAVADLCEKAEALVGDELKVRAVRSVLLDELRSALNAAVDEVRRLRSA
ncbi:MAG: Hpt domain-containing protein [Pseudomonadota bacterium]